MLANVRFFSLFLKKIILLFFFTLININVSANEKDQILNKLNKINSLEFTFNQYINEKNEKGSCLLKFPGKLKCKYFDDKQKELIINNKKLAITQKRYNKTYHYPISKSYFINILYKDKLFEFIQLSEIKISRQLVKLIYKSEKEIIIFFNKNNFDLKGWEITDQFNNKINFSLNIVSTNDVYNEEIFKIPNLN